MAGPERKRKQKVMVSAMQNEVQDFVNSMRLTGWLSGEPLERTKILFLALMAH